jgi:hypothetical protein
VVENQVQVDQNVRIYYNQYGSPINLDALWEADNTVTWFIKIIDIPDDAIYDVILNRYGSISSFNATLSRVIIPACNAFLVFTTHKEFLRGLVLPPLFSRIAPQGTYNPRSVSDIYFRIFSSLAISSDTVVYKGCFEAAIACIVVGISDAINTNPSVQCAMIYVLRHIA